MDWKDIDRIRVPGFTLGRRGYDKHEVDRFLARLADWLETDAPTEIGQMAVTRKLELVGKSTAHILMTTEQESAELRRNAEEEAAQMISEAEAAAVRTREAADEYARQTRAQADADSQRLMAESEAQARENIEEGERRREQIEAVIADLEIRRDDVLSDMDRLRGELGSTIAAHRQAARANGKAERPAKEKQPAKDKEPAGRA